MKLSGKYVYIYTLISIYIYSVDRSAGHRWNKSAKCWSFSPGQFLKPDPAKNSQFRSRRNHSCNFPSQYTAVLTIVYWWCSCRVSSCPTPPIYYGHLWSPMVFTHQNLDICSWKLNGNWTAPKVSLTSSAPNVRIGTTNLAMLDTEPSNVEVQSWLWPNRNTCFPDFWG